MSEFNQIDVIYTDFSDTFNIFDHEVLLDKLSRLDIPTNYVHLIASYLHGRTIIVSYGSLESFPFVSTFSVPQGCNLDHCYFQ